MKTLKEFIGTTGIRVGGYSNVQPIASLGDTPPKKRPGGKNVREGGKDANSRCQAKPAGASAQQPHDRPASAQGSGRSNAGRTVAELHTIFRGAGKG